MSRIFGDRGTLNPLICVYESSHARVLSQGFHCTSSMVLCRWYRSILHVRIFYSHTLFPSPSPYARRLVRGKAKHSCNRASRNLSA